ncbi:MAG: hypothetical protein OXN27_21540 [Candidatus Poribacteria bacterium]|nr:hypothetical protein [Candidatus Poribacteria bacterium]
MKNILTKMGYMAIGCLLTLIGYHFGNVESNNVNAQQSSESTLDIVDKIRVRQLEIVDDEDTLRVKLDRDGIVVYNAMGITRAGIFVDDEDNGVVLALGPGSATGAAAALYVDENGGGISLWNKFIAEPVLEAVITDKGEGFILAKDKAGEDTEVLGSGGPHTYTTHSINIPRKPVLDALTVDPLQTKGGNLSVQEPIKRTIVGGVDVTAILEQIENGRNPDRTLSVGDRFALSDDNVTHRAFIHTNATTINNIRNEIIKFQNQNGRSMIILKNGTVYIAPNGCEITNGVITEGQIEVYYRTRNP